MVTLDARTKQRRLNPSAVLILSCIASLVAGIIFGKYLAAKYQGADPSSRSVVHGDPAVKKPSSTFVATEPVCHNTCPKAKNGVCDDGRGAMTSVNNARKVLCDLGTDCDDCGPWMPSGPMSWDPASPSSSKGPITILREKGIEVRVKNSSTLPSFAFAYTDPTKDLDVSMHFEGSSMVEGYITQIFTQVFNEGCMRGGKRSLFLDVGANFGWYSLLAASMGCRVTAFEPVPHFFAFFEYSVHLNGLAHLSDLRRSVVSNATGISLDMVVPTRGIWGTAGIGGLNIDTAIRGSSNSMISVPSVTLDSEVHEDVLLLKVDVEGWEWSVMQGAAQLLSKHQVENIIMEYSPGVPERHFRHDDIRATIQMLVDIVDSGYRIGHIGDKYVSERLDGPLDPLEEVTKANLQYDLRDAVAFASQQLGCPIPMELRKYRGWVAQCGIALPEDANPFSLRSMIGHNTNLWAAKESAKLLKLRGTVGILKLEDDPKRYFIDEGALGMGSRYCGHIDPMFQVRHRCPCSNDAVCGQEAELVQQLANQGLIANNYRIESGSTAQTRPAGRKGGKS